MADSARHPDLSLGRGAALQSAHTLTADTEP
jgi:hypothetical protein